MILLSVAGLCLGIYFLPIPNWQQSLLSQRRVVGVLHTYFLECSPHSSHCLSLSQLDFKTKGSAKGSAQCHPKHPHSGICCGLELSRKGKLLTYSQKRSQSPFNFCFFKTFNCYKSYFYKYLGWFLNKPIPCL